MNQAIAVICISLLLFSCSKDKEKNDDPSGFTVSQGTAVGTIRITFTKDPDVTGVTVERQEVNGPWVNITSMPGSFDDIHNYPNGMPPGKIFFYRLKNDYPDDAPYTTVKSGFAYDIKPVDELNISSSANMNSLSWNDGNQTSFLNESTIFFDVMRSVDSTDGFKKIAQVGEDRAYVDDLTNNPSLQGIPLYYRIDVHYKFYTLSPFNTGNFFYTEVLEGKVAGSM